MTMQYLRNLNDADINIYLEQGDELLKQFAELEKNGNIDVNGFLDAAKGMCRAFMQKVVFTNPYSGTAAESAVAAVNKMMLQVFKEDSHAIVLIPMTIDIAAVNGDSYDEVINYLTESLALSVAEQKGLDVGSEEEEEEEEIEGVPSVDDINEQLQFSSEFADRGDFENAVASLDKMLDMIAIYRQEGRGILIIDTPGILNNKAYYLFRLNRLQEALTTANEMLKVDEDYAIGYYTKAEILDALGQFQEAIACMDLSIELEDSPDKHAFRKSILKKIN